MESTLAEHLLLELGALAKRRRRKLLERSASYHGQRVAVERQPRSWRKLCPASSPLRMSREREPLAPTLDPTALGALTRPPRSLAGARHPIGGATGMQEHDVVGIGNAIVDIIGRCDDAFLARYGCTKGSMQLVDAATVLEALRRHGTGHRDFRRLGGQHHGGRRVVRRQGRLHRQDRRRSVRAGVPRTTFAQPA